MSKFVLVVDDNEDARFMLRQLLESAGIEVREAHNGEQAIQQLVSAPPSAMILDMMMPKMNGFAVLSLMQRSTTLRNIPVIVLSALDIRADALALPNIKRVFPKGGLHILEIRQILMDILQLNHIEKLAS